MLPAPFCCSKTAISHTYTQTHARHTHSSREHNSRVALRNGKASSTACRHVSPSAWRHTRTHISIHTVTSRLSHWTLRLCRTLSFSPRALHHRPRGPRSYRRCSSVCVSLGSCPSAELLLLLRVYGNPELLQRRRRARAAAVPRRTVYSLLSHSVSHSHFQKHTRRELAHARVSSRGFLGSSSSSTPIISCLSCGGGGSV